MFSIVRKFDRRTGPRRTRRTLHNPFVWSSLLLLFGFIGAGTAAGAEARNAAAAPVGPGPQFAISDFDGDFRPDLASVQAGATTSGSTDYWIQLELSAAGRQSIRLVAPAGGLMIEARDVNGDHAVDLILSTSLRQPVAVFLNDGHGSFSRAAPSAFPEAFSKPLTNWASLRPGDGRRRHSAAIASRGLPGGKSCYKYRISLGVASVLGCGICS
jgi:hypothetical protein